MLLYIQLCSIKANAFTKLIARRKEEKKGIREKERKLPLLRKREMK